jgi:uncharacterized protein (UPF0371 family)
LNAYNIEVVNYNRDIEAFNLLKRILEKITGCESIYQSPTDMGVNRISAGIVNDGIIAEASHQEVIRRYYRCAVEYAIGLADKDSALSNPAAQMALENLTGLRGCEVYSTHIPTPGDEAGFRKLKVNLTCDPEFSSKSLFY